MSASAPGSSSTLRLAPVLRWLGLTLVVLLVLQIAVVLSGADWAEASFQQLLIERLVSQAPMGFVGLLLMLIGSRLDHPVADRQPIRWVVCVLSALLAIAMIAVVPMAISGNQSLAGQADQTLQQRRSQLEMARQQGKNPDNVKMLGEQLAQAGQLPADATDDDKAKAAQEFIDGQLQQMNDQLQQAERQRNLAMNQRRFGGTVSAVVLAIAFVLLAFAAVL
ncbi:MULTISPECIES: HpsJ family protein [unclassified Synechococcus]|uniref:HpsJ family protein n=1 Tax=unclassified Synechococcus TaxID=2626047 RepID=UPI0002E51E2D|nr:MULTISPECIES: HpsJ family protein [unclassified Synechococcus]